ncbi:nuclear factor of activated T-cells, cytoplasmic 4-like [Caloenas nicobarica]|uniref:nuclear factor of activated T-cells, cytoplasmic 4-like n=1 Tax=Caloenas nicobarica TaxID=187106 RepID=UPI0032B8826A
MEHKERQLPGCGGHRPAAPQKRRRDASSTRRLLNSAPGRCPTLGGSGCARRGGRAARSEARPQPPPPPHGTRPGRAGPYLARPVAESFPREGRGGSRSLSADATGSEREGGKGGGRPGDTALHECCSLSAENAGAPRGAFLCERERFEPLFHGERPVVEGHGWGITCWPAAWTLLGTDSHSDSRSITKKTSCRQFLLRGKSANWKYHFKSSPHYLQIKIRDNSLMITSYIVLIFKYLAITVIDCCGE